MFVFSVLSRLGGEKKGDKRKNGERRQHRALGTVGSHNSFPGKAILSAIPGNKLEEYPNLRNEELRIGPRRRGFNKHSR